MPVNSSKRHQTARKASFVQAVSALMPATPVLVLCAIRHPNQPAPAQPRASFTARQVFASKVSASTKQPSINVKMVKAAPMASARLATSATQTGSAMGTVTAVPTIPPHAAGMGAIAALQHVRARAAQRPKQAASTRSLRRTRLIQVNFILTAKELSVGSAMATVTEPPMSRAVAGMEAIAAPQATACADSTSYPCACLDQMPRMRRIRATQPTQKTQRLQLRSL